MRASVLLVCTFFALILLTIPAFAATFTDDMTSNAESSASFYYNLKPFSKRATELSDSSMLTFSSGLRGYVIYAVNGASEVTAGIYTFGGTSVMRGGDGVLIGKGGQQASYYPESDAVFTEVGGLKQLWVNSAMAYEFLPPQATPSGNKMGFGVNIFYSIDGENLFRANASLGRISQETFTYEEYIASVPTSARLVIVEINDVTSLPIVGGGYYQNGNEARFTKLANVKISGDKLVMGLPEPKEPVSTVLPSSSSISSSSSLASKPASKPTSKPASSVAANQVFAAKKLTSEVEEFEQDSEVSDKKSVSSSKFEGTITSSSKSEKSSSSQQTHQIQQEAVSIEEPQSSDSSVESSQNMPPRNETIIYEVESEDKEGRFNSVVTVYIVVAVGAIILYILKENKK